MSHLKNLQRRTIDFEVAINADKDRERKTERKEENKKKRSLKPKEQ